MSKKDLYDSYLKLIKNPQKTRIGRLSYGYRIYLDLDKKEKGQMRYSIKKYNKRTKRNSLKFKMIFLDLAFSKKYYMCQNDEYFMFKFYKKSDRERKTFITGIKKREYIYMLNDEKQIELLKDKYKTYKLLRDLYKRDVLEIKSANDYKKFENFVKKHPKFMKKSNNLSCGKGIEIIKVKDNEKQLFNRMLDESDSVVLEELICQNNKMSILHPESVNTIRIITYVDDNNDIKIKYSFLRIGQGNSFVDNGGAGGIICLIDDETGKVITDGITERMISYKYHPDTCIELKGFQIPEWNNAKELAIKAQNKMKKARLIGWDLAYTDNGWVIIEGNGHTQFIGQQIADQIGKKQPFEKMIHYEKLKKEKQESKYEFSVIIPIYNAEAYLKDTINSVINQTIGFKENIQLILVDDGSTDKSKQICLNYQEKYKDNIKYIYQENKGVSSARNTGMKYIEGKYVNFLDADDKWEKDAFVKVKNFFEVRNSTIDIATCRQKFFEAKTGYPNMDYKFKEAESYIVDINQNPEYMVLSVSSTFIKSRALKNKKFDERLKYGEDAKFLTQILLEKEKYGLVKNVMFYLRKRKDNSSATQNYKQDITKYTNTINYYYEYLIELSKEKYNKVIPYIKHVILNGIKFRICNTIPDILDNKQKNEYITKIKNLLKYIDDKTIIATRNINLDIKYYILNLKNEKKIIPIIDSKNNILYNNLKLGVLNKNNILYLKSINKINKKLIIKGYIKLPSYLNNPKLYINYNNKNHKVVLKNELEQKLSFKDEVIYDSKEFTTELNDIKEGQITFYLTHDAGKIDLVFKFDQNSILKNMYQGYLKINDYIVFQYNRKVILLMKRSVSNIIKYYLK